MDSLVQVLNNNNLTLSVAESCTGGLLSNYFTDRAGSSKYFKGGIVAYSKYIKTKLLGVPEEIDVVSRVCAVSMNAGLKKLFNTDVCVSVTGNLPPFNSYSYIGNVYFSISYLEIDYGYVIRIDNMSRSAAKKKIVIEIIDKIYKTIHLPHEIFNFI